MYVVRCNWKTGFAVISRHAVSGAPASLIYIHFVNKACAGLGLLDILSFKKLLISEN
jgi:hypothetical protein